MILADLVDDYLAKHEATISAGRRRDLVRKIYAIEHAECKEATDRLIRAHNARAAAFRALRDSRKKP